MPEVIVLVEGYAHKEGEVMHASPTTTLIKDAGTLILVDPGTNADALLAALKKQNLAPGDVDAIFLSHYHPDHFLNIRLFPEAKIYDGFLLWQSDAEVPYTKTIPGTSIAVIPTPGHADEHCSLLVETKQGKVCIAADVFWWRDDEQQHTDAATLVSRADDYANNFSALQESRKKLLALADFIIPGHGKIFQVRK